MQHSHSTVLYSALTTDTFLSLQSLLGYSTYTLQLHQCSSSDDQKDHTTISTIDLNLNREGLATATMTSSIGIMKDEFGL